MQYSKMTSTEKHVHPIHTVISHEPFIEQDSPNQELRSIPLNTNENNQLETCILNGHTFEDIISPTVLEDVSHLLMNDLTLHPVTTNETKDITNTFNQQEIEHILVTSSPSMRSCPISAISPFLDLSKNEDHVNIDNQITDDSHSSKKHNDNNSGVLQNNVSLNSVVSNPELLSIKRSSLSFLRATSNILNQTENAMPLIKTDTLFVSNNVSQQNHMRYTDNSNISVVSCVEPVGVVLSNEINDPIKENNMNSQSHHLDCKTTQLDINETCRNTMSVIEDYTLNSTQEIYHCDPRSYTISRPFANNQHELKVLCRVIALHEKKPEVSSTISFSVDNEMQRFRVRLNLDIGQNVRCLCLERLESHTNTISDETIILPSQPSEFIFAFNWFSPTGLWDYITLGIRWAIHPTGLDKKYGLCSDVSMSQANEFYRHPLMQNLLPHLNLLVNKHTTQMIKQHYVGYNQESAWMGNEENKCHHLNFIRSQLPSSLQTKQTKNPLLIKSSNPSKLLHNQEKRHKTGPIITLTGFSMGSSIAHAFAVLLKEEELIINPMRCIGFGGPRPGGQLLTRWCHEKLTSDSLNVILASKKITTTNSTFSKKKSNGPSRYAPLIPPQEVNTILHYPTHHTNISHSNSTYPSISNHSNNFQSIKLQDHITQPKSENQYNFKEELDCLIYDPVTTSPSCCKGFDIHPNVYLLIQHNDKSNLIPMNESHRQHLIYQDLQDSNMNITPTSALINLTTKGSLFSTDVSDSLDKLHSVLKYYEALTALQK